jgi:hypothetical protein
MLKGAWEIKIDEPQGGTSLSNSIVDRKYAGITGEIR